MTFLIHYGTKRHSGRYPWGSGENPQRSKNFLGYVNKLRSKGMTETDIAKAMGLSTTEYRARIMSENVTSKLDTINTIRKLKDKGYSEKAIAERLRMSQKSVFNYLQPEMEEKLRKQTAIRDSLADIVKEKKMVQIGPGSEQQLGISATKLRNVVEELKAQGYTVATIYENQLGVAGKQKTPIKVIAEPGTEYKDIYKNRENIKPINDIRFIDGGPEITELRPVELVNPKRIMVNYKEDGGDLRDGVIELRRGVKDLDLGDKAYAQVRIAVEGDKYLKGMAMYANDLPDGVDIRFNTNKSRIGEDGKPINKLDTMKSFKKDIDGNVDLTNPFGSEIKAGGQRGALNVINEESDWAEWSNKANLSSQFLSKQSTDLAKRQLDLAYKILEDDFNERMALTNPVIKKDMLNSFADKADADAVHLKAAALPRQANKVILPLPDLKENEIYAPTFKDGENLILIRHPHGGRFEIPEVINNRRHKKGKELIGDSEDAIGISPAIAKKLSGADFDGDNVLVIPNKKGSKYEIKADPAIKDLQDFDPKERYSVPQSMLYDAKTNPSGFKPMTKKLKGIKMGEVSNLITDMTIQGAEKEEIIRAVKHSMTVIDAEKHKLNYKQSYIDNNISELAAKYQGKKRGGAATLISRAGSEIEIPLRKQYGIDPTTGKRSPIDTKTGKKLYTDTGTTEIVRKRLKDGTWVDAGRQLKKMSISRMMYEDDAYNLVSKARTPMEIIYADHANKLKDLANRARGEAFKTPPLEYSKTAKKVYETEVRSLNAKLELAKSNKVYERQAQLLANAIYNAKRKANPDLDADDLKKLRGQSLAAARIRVGSKKKPVIVTDSEWNAIQAGAISNYKLTQIIANADKDDLVRRALPKATPFVSSGKINRAKAMMANGYALVDIAEIMGVSESTLRKAIKTK